MLNKLIKLMPIRYTILDSSIKGRSFGVLIQIDEKHKEDKGLLAHERWHVKQFLRVHKLFRYRLLTRFKTKDR